MNTNALKFIVLVSSVSPGSFTLVNVFVRPGSDSWTLERDSSRLPSLHSPDLGPGVPHPGPGVAVRLPDEANDDQKAKEAAA